MEALLNFISGADNIAIMVLMAALAGSGYLHIVWRKEEREDRRQLYGLIETNTRTLEALRTALTITLGKPL